MNKTEFEHEAPQLRLAALKTAQCCGADANAAEDIAQDTMLKLWAIHDSLTDSGKLKSYASIVARRIVFDHARNTHMKIPIGHVAQRAGGAEADRYAEERDNERWLEEKLAKLPSTERQVITMRHVEGRSKEEIARLLGISKDSVVTLLSRTRRRMIEQLKKRDRQGGHIR